jgi:glucuronate isomerase
VILFTLDEDSYCRELAPLAGHYPALKLGPPWWFNDSPEGMRRFRERVTETAGFYNTVGFNDDTRAFLSIPRGTTSPGGWTARSSPAGGRAPAR